MISGPCRATSFSRMLAYTVQLADTLVQFGHVLSLRSGLCRYQIHAVPKLWNTSIGCNIRMIFLDAAQDVVLDVVNIVVHTLG